MVTRNKKPARDIQEIEKETKQNTIESYQHMREESKRIRKEQRITTKPIRKQ